MRITGIAIALLLPAVAAFAQQKTYYVSPDGNDDASGLSVKDAWKTIDKVNSITFLPGDRILFEGGRTFHGQVRPKGSGTAEQPITISAFGDKGRPVINFGDAEGAGILIENASGWEIIGMEITSGAAPEIGIGRQGIAVRMSEPGTYDHFVIKDNHIHDVWGQLGGRGDNVGYNSSGILVVASRPRPASGAPQAVSAPAVMNDVLIAGNRIERVDKCGIVCRGAREDVVVRRNWMDNLGGDGIFVNGPYRGLIEYNVIHRSCMRAGAPGIPGDDGWWPHVAACWIQNTEETIMQFNEVYDTGRNLYNGDGFAYDFDFNCKRCIAQYNYSRNNYGLMLLMYNIFENVTRYNISENDHTHLIQMQGPRIKDGNVIYNNVFYVDYGVADIDFFLGNDAEQDPDLLGARFWNNIFYATGQGRFRTVYSSGATETRNYDESLRPDLPSGSIFLHNCYFGPWSNGLPDDPEALVTDPGFVAPGTGGIGLCTLKGYMLRPDSPCINTGIYVPNAGARDFFGNTLDDGHPDFGVFEQPGSGAFADGSEEQKDEIARKASQIAWAKWMFPASIASNSPDGPAIVLREALEDGISGKLSWSAPDGRKPVVLDISKLKDRKNIQLPLKADKATLEGSTLKVSITNGSFSEEWEIPFVEETGRRR